MGGTSGGPVVKNLPCGTGDGDSIPGWGTEISHAAEQLQHTFWSRSATTRVHVLQ